MKSIEIIFLGTGSVFPTNKRNHPGVFLRYKNEGLLFDCGEGIQRQFKIKKISPCKITKILITHWHGDHILGLGGLLQTLALNNYSKELEIYGPPSTKKHIKKILEMFMFIGKIKIKIIEIRKPGIFFENDDFELASFKLKHSTTCLGYYFKEKDKRKIKKDFLKEHRIKPCPLLKELKKGKTIFYNGKKISPKNATFIKKGRKISYIVDTEINENCFRLARNSDILIIEATFTKEHEDKAKERKHLTAEQAAKIAKKSKSKKVYFIHLSQRYEGKENEVLKEGKKIFRNIKIPDDLDIVKI